MNWEPLSKGVGTGKPLSYWSRDQIRGVWAATGSLKTVADCCRLNSVTAIQAAGSGHIGTSLSSLDIMVAVRRFLGGESFLDGDGLHKIFFSSKGHDAPAFYSVMHACGQLDDDDIFTLRRLGGLPGHPETVTPGVPTNTGSLGMGISKAKGFVKAQRLKNPALRQPVVVMLGDGELNEGQIWESMPGAVRDGYRELTAIVDANQIQSDTWVEGTLPMGDLRKRAEGAGWAFLECDGNDPEAVLAALTEAEALDSPVFLVATTVKGSGVPWMEAFPDNGEYYKFHSGALDPVLYAAAAKLLIAAVGGESPVVDSQSLPPTRPEFDPLTPRTRPESMLTLWERMLTEVMARNPQVIALDGDLSYDTGTHLARKEYSERYIQSGIAEQDMVSMAGTLALSGFAPIVHSFATFLTMRATEQIFNNATEYSPIIYMGFLAGLVPSAPGFSHQAVTDVGIMSTIPGMRVFEPSCPVDLAWSVEQALTYGGPSFIRMGGLTPLEGVPVTEGWATRRVGRDVALVASGPLLAQQAVGCATILEEKYGKSAAVFTMAELTVTPPPSAMDALQKFSHVFVLENHNPALAKFELLRQGLAGPLGTKVTRVGLEGVPANGQAEEVLHHHGLDVESLAHAVMQSE